MLINKHSAHRSQKGFTLVEMLVVAPIVILAIGAFLTVIISMTGEVISSRAANALTYNVQDALTRIEQDTKLSTGFLRTNNVPLTATGRQGVNDDTTNFTNVGGASGTSLILNMVATNGNPLSNTSQYVFLKDSPNPCASAFQINTPLTYNVVYFVKTVGSESTLWRRTIMPQQYADTTNYACAATWQQPSCNPAVTNSTICVTQDIELVRCNGTCGLTIDYYVSPTSTTPISSPGSNSALSTATTVRVGLDVEQTAAGRTISNKSSIVATRLDTNASELALPTPATTPVAPFMRSNLAPGAKGVFSWDPVPGATGYTFEYNINGGAWVTGFTNQNTRTFTVSAPAHEDVINARVSATNTAGTSSFDTGTVTTPLWEPLLLQNGWFNYGAPYSTGAYTKTRAGIVVLKGLIRDTGTAAVTSGEIAAILPPGYRPGGGRLLFGSTSNPNVTARVDVDAGGNVVINNGNTGWTSLETVRFAADGRYTRTTATPLNGWTQYGGSWAPAQYTTDSEGRVVLQGLLAVGTGTFANGTRLLDLPSSLYPPQYMHVLTSSNILGYIGLEYRAGSTTVVAKNVGNSFLSTTAMYYPTGTTGWTNLTLQNGWTWYGNGTSNPIYSSPQFKKGTDNIVSLKGLLLAGTTSVNTILTTLPVGMRPKERILMTSVSGDAHIRLDILTTGEIIIQGGTVNVWISLDGISFVGEQ